MEKRCYTNKAKVYTVLEVVFQVLQWFDKPSPLISSMLNEINMFLKKEINNPNQLGLKR